MANNTEHRMMPAQGIAWDEDAWIGYSVEQREMIRKGFMYGLNRAYEAELDAAGPNPLDEFCPGTDPDHDALEQSPEAGVFPHDA